MKTRGRIWSGTARQFSSVDAEAVPFLYSLLCAEHLALLLGTFVRAISKR